METRVINGVSHDVYTMKDWESDGVLKVGQGQIIEPSVFYELRDAVPPTTYKGMIFQCGEPYAHDWNNGLPLYKTFIHVGEHYYRYVGLCYEGYQGKSV